MSFLFQMVKVWKVLLGDQTMKSLSFLVSLVFLTSVQAFECSQNEAQFIGNVTELKVTRIDQGIWDCTYKISFTRFNPSIVCPLDMELAAQEEFQDYNCSRQFTNGDEISGILVEKNGSIFIE